MFKNILMLFVYTAVLITPVSAIAASADSVSVVNVEDSTNNDVALLQVIDGSTDMAENATSQPPALSAEDSESVLSTEWLFAVALFWFVLLSNRRGV